MRRLLLALLLAAAPAYAQQPTDSAQVERALDVLQRLQPGVTVHVVRVEPGGFGIIAARRLHDDPVVRAQRARHASLLDDIAAAELAFRPVLRWSAGHNRYNTYDRPAVVNARVPVAWDNENPVQADINLPNGGRGLIWLPKPTDYADRDIIVHASRQYESELSTAALGLSKAYASGLQLSIMNLSLNHRSAPKTYTHPWSMGVSNSLELPLLRGAGGSGMLATMELLNERENARIAAVDLRAVELDRTAGLLGRCADLLAGWELYRSALRRGALLEEQLADLSLLRERQVLTAFELVRIRDAVRDARQEADVLAESYVLAVVALQPDIAERDTLQLFVPAPWDADLATTALDALALRLLAETHAAAAVERLPALRASRARLQQASNELGFTRSQQRPQLSLRGSLDLFQADDIGYRTTGQAIERAFVQPDGVLWNVGVVGEIPLGREARARRQAAEQRVRAAEAELAAVRQELQDQGRELAMRVRAAGNRVRLARGHFTSADSLAVRYATPLYEARRLSRAEHAGFLADVESSRMDWVNAWREYYASVTDLARFADVDLEPLADAVR